MTASESIAIIRRSLGAAALPPVTLQVISAFEQQHRLELPADAVLLLNCFNGSTDSTPDSLVSFRPLEEWVNPAKVAGLRYVHLPTAFVFADHCHESWWFAVDLKSASSTPVYLVNGAREEQQIASSLAEFLQAVAQDGRLLYGMNVGTDPHEP